MNTKFDVVILAGGKSSRVKGINKALLLLLDKPLIKWVIDSLKKISNSIIIVVHDERQKREIFRFSKFSSVKVVIDKFKNLQFPIVGALTGAEIATSEVFFLISCDQPFITPGIVLEMVRLCQNADACVPRWPNGYLEPLSAVYRREKYLNAVYKVLRRGERRSIAPLKYLKCIFIDVYKLTENPEIVFYNINTLEDYLKAKEIASNL